MEVPGLTPGAGQDGSSWPVFPALECLQRAACSALGTLMVLTAGLLSGCSPAWGQGRAGISQGRWAVGSCEDLLGLGTLLGCWGIPSPAAFDVLLGWIEKALWLKSGEPVPAQLRD